MALFRTRDRTCLNVSSDSPLVGPPSHPADSPNLDASPFVYRRTVGYVGNPPHLLGTPSYPTPLDDVRVGHSYTNADSKQHLRPNFCGTPRSQLKDNLIFRSQENGVSTPTSSPLRARRCLVDATYSPTLVNGCPFMIQEEKGHFPGEVAPQQLPNCIDPTLVLNPNKAVLTLDPRGKILTVNDMTTLLLGEDLVRDGATLFDLLARPSDAATVRSNLLNRHSHPSEVAPAIPASLGTDKTITKPQVEVAAEQDVLDEAGMVVFSGNVVSVRAEGDVGEMPVSLWMKELPTEVDEEATWIAVIEPITITVAKVTVNKRGLILDADQNFLIIFGSEAVLDNDNLFCFISSLKLPEEQNEEWEDHPCTGCAKEGDLFPLSVSVSPINPKDYHSVGTPQDMPLFNVKIKLFSNISGLVIVDENGVIMQYNHNFTRLLFGYGSKELEGQSIIQILPEFPKVSCRHRPVNKNLFGIHPLKDENVPLKAPNVDSISIKDSFLPYVSHDPSFKENTRFAPPEYPMSNSEKLSGLFDVVDSSNEVAHPMANYTNDQNANLERSSSPNKAFILSDSSQFSCSNLPSRSSPRKLSSVSLVSNPSFIQGLHKAPESFGSPIQTGITPAQVMRDITNSMGVFNMSECLDQSRFPPNLGLLTSTPSVVKGELMIEEGSYFGVGKHKDGSIISILYQIRRLNLGGKDRFCLWITWEPTDSSLDDSKHRFPTSSLETPASHSTRSGITRKDSVEMCLDASSCTQPASQSLGITTSFSDEDEDTSASVTRTDGSSCNDYSLSHSFRSVKQRSFSENDLFGERGLNGSKRAISNFSDEPEWILTSGDYISRYTILRQIGKGAFGYVKMSYRNNDGLIVITKFIKKSQVYKDSWTVDPTTGRKLCLEVDLLLKLDHPNIVKALDYFENEKYFQLVMEKWGSGMDLFEFIDRNPALDEPLISYIFRQIVSPLQYLRSLNIIHRDIKDENIIINQAFHIKLIDFGSATYLQPNKKFSQFAGTIEYCSPEVLKGHRYCGPELEVWSLGITLYTLVFGENPFSTVEQVLKDPLIMPISYSDDLFTLLDGMLKKNQKERMSLDNVANHYWTRQLVDMEFYSFEDIVPCENYELSPPRYVSDYGFSEESLSTTSSSFVYEERRSQSATESYFLRHSNTYRPTYRLPEEDENVTTNSEGMKVTANSSRTSTHSASSLKSSITIDSSVFYVSPEKWSQKKTRSTLSSSSNLSTSEMCQTPSNPSSCHKRSTKQTSDSLFSLTSLSSSNPSRSSSSTSSTSCNSSENSTSSDDAFSSNSGTSSNSGRSNTSSSSLGSQETVSVDSNSQDDDQTLANTFTNVLVLEKEEENPEYFNHG